MGLPFAPLPAAPAGTACSEAIIGTSKKMLDVLAVVTKVAASNANVCIVGESGTGKELIARAIHDNSLRRDRPLVTLDCPAVPDGLMESRLFGHVKGAFTGAVDHREGVFALAHTGTLFIDELCELALPLQAKLLRVLQSREFFKVGGTKPIRTDIRLITATNKDPKREVERGTFREDLYYRVAVVVIKVPALRERTEDIPLMVEHFLRKFSTACNKPIRGVERSAMGRLMELPWPGNVRQLENVIEQAVVLAEGDTLGERDFVSEPDLFAEESSVPGDGAPPVQPEPGLPLDEVERRHILGTLHRVHGNRTEAARLLGISLRCLQYKLKAYREDAPLPGLLPQSTQEASMGQLYVVARDRPELYERLTGNFVHEPDAQVILDRRFGGRRQRPETRWPERRKADRRWRPLVDANLRSLGWAVVRTR